MEVGRCSNNRAFRLPYFQVIFGVDLDVMLRALRTVDQGLPVKFFRCRGATEVVQFVHTRLHKAMYKCNLQIPCSNILGWL